MYRSRFFGVQSLYGETGLDQIRQAHVCVIGVGGVGSWTVESLARSGVGHITVVDPDDICVSNINRQSHALTSTVGQPKVEVIKKRIAEIQPDCQVRTLSEFFSPNTAEMILDANYHMVLDACDDVQAKMLLINLAKDRQLPIAVSGGAGGRSDPSQVTIGELAFSNHDPMLFRLRRHLRNYHQFEGGVAWGIPCVYSRESPVISEVKACEDPVFGATEAGPTCDQGYGTASFVTGTMGFHLASVAINHLNNSLVL